MEQQSFSTTQICPVSTYAVLGALDDFNLLQPLPVIEETFILIWFDPNIENMHRMSSTFSQNVHDLIRYYTDFKECINVIKSIVTSKIVLVTATEVAKDLLPNIVKLRSVDSVILYSTNSADDQFNADDYSKVVGGVSNINEIRFRLANVVERLDEHLRMRRSFRICKSKTDIVYEFGDFLWLNFLIEATKILGCGDGEINQFSNKGELVRIARIYYRGDCSTLKKIDQFDMNYQSQCALQSYTAVSFPFKLLNKALRTENWDLLMPFLFFIVDINNCLALEHDNLNDEGTNILHRGMRMSLEEFEKLEKTKGELISMNGFLSTSRSRHVAEFFSGSAKDDPGTVAIIFQIECDTVILDNNLVFADISKYSDIPDEEEVLISIGAVFRIRNIKQDLDGRWVIDMMGSSEIKPQEFAASGACEQFQCGGRPCAKCHKCRDWHFSGDQDSWNWVCNHKNWNDVDWRRWYNDREYKFFTKRGGATCSLGDFHGGLLLGLYDGDGGFGLLLGLHLCLCEKH
ncbi:unnamed protein product [Adineta steineri]|uniref:NAD(P)(+)--arginine ADP-ribosyltransferase n=1 Tax=Adineta steineri TaxID=433720 RepID=A0A816E082_9BILA|nr:unnamed protein product [Adineta steineri]CAF1640502.1 unnamed protein product [Adineta steineri]